MSRKCVTHLTCAFLFHLLSIVYFVLFILRLCVVFPLYLLWKYLWWKDDALWSTNCESMEVYGQFIRFSLYCYFFWNALWHARFILFPFNTCFLLVIFLLLFMYLLVLIAAMLKRPRTPPTNNPTMDYQTADSEHVLKRSRPFGITDEV